MKKLQHIIMIALILIGLATPALAQDQTDSFNVAGKTCDRYRNHYRKSAL